MVVTTPENAARSGAAARALARIVERRWLIVAAVVVVAGLALGGAASWTAALIAGLVLVAALLIVPLPSSLAGAVDTQLARPAASTITAAFGRFADALPDPCFLLDRRGTVLYANARAVAMFSIRAGDAITFRLRVPDVVAAFDRVAKGGAPELVEFSERVPTERWFAAWLAMLEPTKTSVDGSIILLVDDLSERRNADRVRVDFVANASHELRTPLASLAGFIETLQGPARDDTAARERFLGIMHEQAERMRRIVNDLLSLSRIEMKAHLRPTDRVDVVDVIAHVIETMEPLARSMGVSIEAQSDDEQVFVTGDRDELTQVFSNLIENACKYGQSGRRVVVSAKLAADGRVAMVRDFGPGISEAHLPRLTERFYRVDAEESRRHRGTGLGLAIVKHILARHRARLAIDSRLGEGATFSVIFPKPEEKDEQNQAVVVSQN